jgi:choline dehydrogenase-like flavoprotein
MSQMIWLLVSIAIALFAQGAADAPLGAEDFVAALEADYVIVGGGTAGCALAARICEGLPNATVVLLERSLPRTPEQVRFFFSLYPCTGLYPKAGQPEAWNAGEHCEAYKEDVRQPWRSRCRRNLAIRTQQRVEQPNTSHGGGKHTWWVQFHQRRSVLKA